MNQKNFDWTYDLTLEFSKVVLDNYHNLDNIDEETNKYIKTKLNGRRNAISNFIWEDRNNFGGTVR